VPAQLGFLAIFNPELGNTDETLDDQIVYYASATSKASSAKRRRTRSRPTEGVSQEERNERLRQIGLAQGMIRFGRDFADGEAVDSIDTERTRVVIHELEPGWWILAVSSGFNKVADVKCAANCSFKSVDLNKVPLPPRLLNSNENQSDMYDYNSKEMKPPPLILRDLLRAHRIFLMHHDSSLRSLFLRTKRPKFVALLSRYWDLFLSTWNVLIHGNPARDVFGGINIAASGELGVGVGEEERGSGEREVLEVLVERVEGLVDLVVSKFGEAGTEADHVSSSAPWLGSGREPAAGDGAIFLGTGAITKKSLRDVTHWMEDLYTWGNHAYGVIESPVSTRKTKPRHSSKQMDEPAPSEEQPQNTDDTAEPAKDPDDKKDKGKQAKTAEEDRDKTRKNADDGKLDKMVSYLKLGYGDYWTIPGVPSSFGTSGQQSTEPPVPSNKDKQAIPEPRPKLPQKSPSQEAEGHYLIGLKGEIEEGSGEQDGSVSDDSESDTDPRTVLRTLHVEMANESDNAEQDATTPDLTIQQMQGTLRPGANPQGPKTERLRVVVYVNKPFIFVFLFDLRTDSLAWDALYRSLHYQLSPLRKPLLASTQYRPERPNSGTGTGSSPGIDDLVWNPLDLTVHSTIPNIPGSVYGDIAAEKHWSRADAVSTHLHIIHIFGTTRSASNLDIERTQKTSRGWWVVWTRLIERPPAPQSSSSARDSPSTTAPPSPSAASGEPSGGGVMAVVEDPLTTKEIILIRRASDHAGAAGSGTESAGKLAHGIGVDTRRYVEDLLNIL
jgi:hypothetical protein